MKIKIFCEGKTEKGLRTLITNAVNQNSTQNCGFKVKSYDGVNALLKNIDRKIAVEIREGAKIVYCIVDFYHFPIKVKSSLSVERKVNLIKEYIDNQLGELKSLVRVFVIIHEVETWILADSDVI